MNKVQLRLKIRKQGKTYFVFIQENMKQYKYKNLLFYKP